MIQRSPSHISIHRLRKKQLGLLELIAIALGGMVGGGIFTILGIAVSFIGYLTPIAIVIGGGMAGLAAYSYVQLGLYYQDEGATYSFYKRTYAHSHFSASVIGWFITFGYISTLALYAYTFSSYALSSTSFADQVAVRKAFAIGIIAVFAYINLWSVNGMGKVEDIMVYTKIAVLAVLSVILMAHGKTDLSEFAAQMAQDASNIHLLSILIVASLTFVAYEGFQLVINAIKEMKHPEKNIPRAIYSAIALAIVIYVVIVLGALFALPLENIVHNKEYALAAGAAEIVGQWGANLVIAGALLATSSAISGTVFGASRQVAVIAQDGYFPGILALRRKGIPYNAIVAMALMSSILIVIGGLELILEFGSMTFLLVSLLMAIANFKIRDKTRSSTFLTTVAILGLAIGGGLFVCYEFVHKWKQMLFILLMYLLLALFALGYAKTQKA